MLRIGLARCPGLGAWFLSAILRPRGVTPPLLSCTLLAIQRLAEIQPHPTQTSQVLRMLQPLARIPQPSIFFPQIGHVQQSPISPEASESKEADNTVHLDSVLRKRRLKMKKHKLRKRRKRQRSLKIRLGKI
ncbi:hypothetical protein METBISCDRAFT_27847 [Metschnikowia bicuspidata]|uniref:Small ribosomal subunit protein mS38 n=1 Tax=Metschnikowia bicuspidata TaxID=27322 RepID=A0A4V1J2V9_9ASCO|nr:hypothetical protein METBISCDRAFT_27847 [Metschnikowia bicuspidata]